MASRTTQGEGGRASLAAFAMAVIGVALLAAVSAPATSGAAAPASGSSNTVVLQAQPTAETRQTNNQGGSQGQNPVNGGSTQNQNGANDNSISSGENTNQSGQTGSTSGGNPVGNTGGAGGTGIINWWTIILAAITLAVIVAVWMRVRPIKQIATSIGGIPADQQERDEKYKH